jgi:UDP-glucose 4-epimerase
MIDIGQSASGRGTVVVIGAAGFVGFYLVRYLQQAGYRVLAVDKSVNEEASYLIDKGASFIPLDIVNEEEFDRLPKQGVQAVVNLACVQPAANADSDPAIYIKVNVLGVANILKYCQRANVEKVLHTISHRNIQGLWEKGGLITEEAPRAIKYTGKFAVFSISESAAADLMEHYVQQYGMKCVLFRLPSVYGFGHHESAIVSRAVAKTGLGVLIDNARNGRAIEVWGDSQKGRDVVYVKDVVSAIALALESEDACGLFNIASGKSLSLKEQVESIIKVFSPHDKRSTVVYRPEISNSIEACSYDISKAARELGWSPRYSFDDMLSDYKSEMERGELSFLLSRKHRMLAEQSS